MYDIEIITTWHAFKKRFKPNTAIHLHYRQYGAGPPLIILHGLFGSSDNWHSLARRWGQTFTVYVPDLRNHGSAPHEAAMSYGVLAGDMADFMQQHGLAGSYLLGHSMGGKIAMLLAGLAAATCGCAIMLGTGRPCSAHHCCGSIPSTLTLAVPRSA